MTALLGVAIPFAHAGHVLIDLPIYLGPVVVVVVWLKIADWRQKRSGKRRSSNGASRPGNDARRGSSR
jgi:hypothetical protein